MTKPILLFLATIFAFSSQAQNNLLHQFEIKGGYLIDWDDQRVSFLDDNFGDEYRLNYQGLKYLAVGYTRVKDKTRLGIELDYFKFGGLNPDYREVTGTVFPTGRSKEQIQIAVFYGRSIFQSSKLDLFVAPIASIAYRDNTLRDISSHPIPVQDWVIGLGGKLQVNYNLTDRFGISAGSKLMVLDYYRRNVGNSVESTNHFDFLRGDAALQLGLVFSI